MNSKNNQETDVLVSGPVAIFIIIAGIVGLVGGVAIFSNIRAAAWKETKNLCISTRDSEISTSGMTSEELRIGISTNTRSLGYSPFSSRKFIETIPNENRASSDEDITVAMCISNAQVKQFDTQTRQSNTVSSGGSRMTYTCRKHDLTFTVHVVDVTSGEVIDRETFYSRFTTGCPSSRSASVHSLPDYDKTMEWVLSTVGS